LTLFFLGDLTLIIISYKGTYIIVVYCDLPTMKNFLY